MNMKIKPREIVILAEDYSALSSWYKETFKLDVTLEVSDNYHYSHMMNQQGLQIGVADAKEMGVEPQKRDRNTAIMQIEVEDVKAFFAYIEEQKGSIQFGPSLSEEGFWYGAILDIEGNPIWVVDSNCP